MSASKFKLTHLSVVQR